MTVFAVLGENLESGKQHRRALLTEQNRERDFDLVPSPFSLVSDLARSLGDCSANRFPPFAPHYQEHDAKENE